MKRIGTDKYGKTSEYLEKGNGIFFNTSIVWFIIFRLFHKRRRGDEAARFGVYGNQ